MKMNNRVIAILLAASLLLGGAGGWLLAVYTRTAGNYSNEMKMVYRTDYADGGANAVEREGERRSYGYP